ncbi:MAG TPA: hypothetical protein VN364_12290 [Bellilinea sp.]|nr:hypothetical protein [Bellilinea sp.]
MMQLSLLIILFISLNLAACSAGSVSGPAISLTISNQTPADICEVYASSQESNEWGASLLPEGNSVSAGEERAFQLPAGVYDILVLNCDGISIFSAAQIAVNSSFQIGGAGWVPITVENAFNGEVCYLYISNQGEGDWGVDQLGGVESILPGGVRIFYVPAGSYRLRAEDCTRNPLKESGIFDSGAGLTWTVGNPLQ